MKRSTRVAGPLFAFAMLIILTGCRQVQMQRCVDEHNIVVDDGLCEGHASRQNINHDQTQASYRFYYGGAGAYYPGSVATGGGYTPTSGQAYATSRAGFNQGRAARK
jgi:hypothetical protein